MYDLLINFTTADLDSDWLVVYDVVRSLFTWNVLSSVTNYIWLVKCVSWSCHVM